MKTKQYNELEIIKAAKPVLYPDAMHLMQGYVQNIISGNQKDTLWFLEHDDVYTAGISAKDDELIDQGSIPVYHVNRGGKYTYHGIGQRIIYIMIDVKRLHKNNPDIRKFIKNIECIIISTLRKFGVNAGRSKNGTGIWEIKQNKKIAYIGFRVKRWVTYHGISININPNLKNFDGIVPCGIKNGKNTSLKELGIKTQFEDFDNIFITELNKKLYENK